MILRRFYITENTNGKSLSFAVALSLRTAHFALHSSRPKIQSKSRAENRSSVSLVAETAILTALSNQDSDSHRRGVRKRSPEESRSIRRLQPGNPTYSVLRD